ncbi:hypothetical protein PVK06_002136 [Gossypium arboreum]|uniref:Aminotransferase-like plant mobile domain-containing protein n=1 Tax=Gossypium arboreum TaxID=29729 RepID=A0ABR0R309_GOSAR|nr:hypothetical protein PVK06_002136 [Gossypium arboreum]
MMWPLDKNYPYNHFLLHQARYHDIWGWILRYRRQSPNRGVLEGWMLRYPKVGIAMAVLIKNDGHISNTVNNMGPYSALRGRVNGLGYFSDERLMPYLELAKFRSAALIWTFDLQYDLISALVERWCLETYTFHLLCRECTVTLEDVALQLGLQIDRSAVTGGSVVLAMLYRELCWTTQPGAVDIGGCLVLLQLWALYRMPFLASVRHQPYIFPLVNK